MLSTKLKEAAGNSADATLYVDDVFSTYLYTGNGSTQTITNGIDLAGKGGLVWVKNRTTPTNTGDHRLYDTARGVNNALFSNTTDSSTSLTSSLTSFDATGFSLGTNAKVNESSVNWASWTFRKAAKFFDVVTYTGTGSARTIAHSLGVAPGMVIVKRTDTTGNWQVYSNGLTSAAYSIQLNLTDAQASAPTVWNSTAPTSSVFSVGTDATVNASGGTYVAYLFAHDTSSTGIIQCGSYVGGGASAVSVTLGFEPQWILVKSATGTNNWHLVDAIRGWRTPYPVASSNSQALYANTSSSEGDVWFGTTATGFVANDTTYGSLNTSGQTYIYMAIRRPNKPPTTGTQVYSPQIATQNLSNNTLPSAGFPIDTSIMLSRDGTFGFNMVVDRLRGKGGGRLLTNDTGAENWTTYFNFDAQTNLYITGALESTPHPFVFWNFKRAPGFFDEVCYTGTGSATTQAHNLGAVPELMIVKNRTGVGAWGVYTATTGNSSLLELQSTGAVQTGAPQWNSTTPTSSVFSLGVSSTANASGSTYVAYLFATLAGISKVSSYTGNGTSQNIECGFAAGARFVLIKRTDSAGDWYVWDTARGIVAANDPHLSLNTTAAEVTTDDSIDPYAAGFAVNQVAATNINVSSATYIFLAIA